MAMQVIRKICCCNGVESDNEELISDDNGETEVVSVRPNRLGARQSNDDINRLWATGSAPNSTAATPQGRNVNQGDEEEEILNQIVDAAQQNIIGVGNVEGNVVPDREDLTRAQIYEDAVKRHDARIRKRTTPTHTAAAPIGTALPENSGSPGGELLHDVGPQLIDLLSRPSLSPSVISSVKEMTQRVAEAIEQGIKIEPKQDILVYMPFGDD
ncbi:hypothetical protein AB6A40_004989 [Gnathostoma spinigerum]|uniref:Late endosomal/lysosomal adaptor and MAPK and MTOR activator 1 n=1 Tax=Gnathostoma spinigerum TaxID=75299 RepID=A0ABD6EFA0_9BILA